MESYVQILMILNLLKLVSEKTCAILVEPIQGEGGIRPAKRFLKN